MPGEPGLELISFFRSDGIVGTEYTLFRNTESMIALQLPRDALRAHSLDRKFGFYFFSTILVKMYGPKIGGNLLQYYLMPWDKEREFGRFMEFYGNERYRESLKNLEPLDAYEGLGQRILDRRELIKRQSLRMRYELNLGNAESVS